jgi:hypothetical protein
MIFSAGIIAERRIEKRWFYLLLRACPYFIANGLPGLPVEPYNS